MVLEHSPKYISCTSSPPQLKVVNRIVQSSSDSIDGHVHLEFPISVSHVLETASVRCSTLVLRISCGRVLCALLLVLDPTFVSTCPATHPLVFGSEFRYP